MNALLRLSDGLRQMLEGVARASSSLLIAMAAVTCFDVLARKTGIPAPLTKLQELEWHFHAVLFSLWMGYGYTINAHPRVDSYTENLTLRRKAWFELVGCLLFALPYMAIVAYHTLDFVSESYLLVRSPTARSGSATAGSSRASTPPGSGWWCWGSSASCCASSSSCSAARRRRRSICPSVTWKPISRSR